MPDNRVIKSAFFGDLAENIDWVYGRGRREAVGSLTDCYPQVISSANFEEHASNLADLQVIFSTWGIPKLGADHLDRLPNLKAVFYAAGSVKHFARPLLERGITIFSSWVANAIPVAEFTLAQILLSNKGYFRSVRDNADGIKHQFVSPGNYDVSVALLGGGKIGRRVIDLLRPFNISVLLFDPFVSAKEAKALGVVKVSLEEAFARASVVSNHLPNLPATVGMLKGCHFASMRENATFINTGRSATVVEAELVTVLNARSDLTALLDLANEPGLWKCSNALISSHIAGSLGNEVARMADYMIDEFKAWRSGRKPRFSLDLPMLETMA